MTTKHRARQRITELIALVGEPEARAIVSDIGANCANNTFDAVAARLQARTMLAARKPRRSIAYYLAARYQISLTTAYRRLSEAMAEPF